MRVVRAITMTEFGGPEVMRWESVPDPQPGPGEVLLDVAAAGVNRADLLQRQGKYHPPAGGSDILGLECSGTIAELGAGVRDWAVGDRVCALLTGGGYAEKVVVPTTQLLPVPDGLALTSAAALPEVAATVWSNLVLTAHLRTGQLLLIHGGGGGVGTHAIQVAKRLGARVAVTAGSAAKLRKCHDLGADILINYHEDDFVAALQSEGGADVILDNIGAAYLSRNIDALASDGQLVIIGMQGGITAELNIGALLVKRGSIHATNLRGRPATGPGGKAEIITEVRRRLWPLVAEAAVVPVIYAELPMPEAPQAHRLLDDHDTFGKVVLRTPQ